LNTSGNAEWVQVVVESTIARLFKCGCYTVIDEHGSPDVTDRNREQRIPRVLTKTATIQS
jgi:hypothetical protein